MAEQLKAVVATFTCPSATGTHDFTTTDLGGLTPKAAIFLGSRNTTVNSTVVDAIYSIGSTDGNSQSCVAAKNDDYINFTRTEQTESYCLRAGHANQGTNDFIWDVQGAFSAWITNGVTLQMDTVTSGAYFQVLFLAGADLQVKHGRTDMPASSTATQNVTAPGFTPDAVLFNYVEASTLNAPEGYFWWTSLGWAINDGGPTQTSVVSNVKGGYSSTSEEDTQEIITSGAVGGMNTGSLDFYYTISNFDASGFSVTPSASYYSLTYLYWLAIQWGSNSQIASVIQSVGSADSGTTSFTGYGFQPQAVFGYLTRAEATDNLYYDVTQACGHGLAMLDAQGNMGALNPIPALAASTSSRESTWTVFHDHWEIMDEVTPATIWSGTFGSIQADGFALNVGTSPGATLYFPTIAFEDPAAGGPDITGSGAAQASDATVSAEASRTTDVHVATVVATAPTTPGTLDITTSALGGKTPKAALIFVSHIGGAGAVASGENLSVGFTDGTSQFTATLMGQDGSSGAATARALDNTNCAVRWLYDLSSFNRKTQAAFNAWIADSGNGQTGIQLDFGVAQDGDTVVVQLFAGDSVQAQAGYVTGGVAGSSSSVTTGFSPSAVLFANTNQTAFAASSVTADGTLSFGWDTPSGGANCLLRYTASGANPTDVQEIWDQSEVAGSCDGAGGWGWSANVSSWASDGFTLGINPTRGDSGGALIPYLALRWGSGQVASATTVIASTDSGTTSYTPGQGFQAKGLVGLASKVGTAGTWVTGAHAESASLLMAGGAGNDRSVGTYFADGVTSSNTTETWNNSLELLESSAYLVANLLHYDTMGMTLDVVTPPPADVNVPTLFFQDPTGAIDAQGAAQAGDATTAGSAGRVRTATAAASAQDATVSASGSAFATQTGTAAAAAQPATATASGTVTWTATGAATAQAATVSASGTVGAATKNLTATATVSAQPATAAATATKSLTATATASAQPATTAGTGQFLGKRTGTAAVAADPATVSATGLFLGKRTGTAAVSAQPATSTAKGIFVRQGTAAVQASDATVSSTQSQSQAATGTAQAGYASVTAQAFRVGYLPKGPAESWVALARPTVWGSELRLTKWTGPGRSTSWKG